MRTLTGIEVSLAASNIASCCVHPSQGGQVSYAFYIYRFGEPEPIDKIPYSESNICEYVFPRAGKYRFRAFAKLRSDEIISGTSDWFEIEAITRIASCCPQTRYPVKTLGIADIESENFRPATPTVYAIEWGSVTYEFLISHKPKHASTVIFGTGTITRDVSLPVFSRASWHGSYDFDGIWYFDPTCYLGSVKLGWGYGTQDRWFLHDIAEILQIILRKQGRGMENTLFFGSSGGGFTAIALASLLKCRVTAINPQFFVENYSRPLVDILRKAVLPPGEGLIKERCDLFALFEKFGIPDKMHIIENLCSQPDINRQLFPFIAGLGGCPTALELSVSFYKNEEGHNGMPAKEETIEIIEADLMQNSPPKPTSLLMKAFSFMKRK